MIGRRASGVYLTGLMLFGGPLLGTVLAPAAVQAQTAQLQQAYSLLGRGLVNQAIAAFERYLRANPQSVDAQLGLAIAYRRAGRDAEAFRAYQRVLELDPNNRLALSTLGVLGEFRPEWQDEGIAALTTLLNLEPNNVEARAQRAKLLFFQGRFAESVADYDIVLQGSPTPAVLLTAAQVYTYSGNPQRGLELFNRYRSTGGQITGDAAIAYAVALRETGNVAQSIQLLQAQLSQSRQLDANQIQIRGALATAFAQNQQFAEAEAVLAPLRGRADSRLTLARALSVIARSNPAYAQETAALYRQVLAETPNPSPSLLREVADVLSGIPQERAFALQLYQQLAQQQPNDRSLVVQQLVLGSELGTVSRAQLRQQLRTSFATLPTDSVQLQQIAQALIRLDPPDPELLPLYQALLTAGANEEFLNFRIAQIQIQQGNYTAARSALSAYSTTPAGGRDQGAILLLLADIDRREGNLEGAAQRYQTILASGITSPSIVGGALRGLAGIRQSQGRPQEAIAIYDQIIALNPQDTSAQLGRAGLALQAGLLSQADAANVLNAWLQTRPLTDTPPELYSLAGALPANPAYEPLYVALLENEPTSVPIQLRYLQVVAARDPALAEAQIQQLIARDPNNIGAYFVQGELAQQLGNYALAEEAYEAILQRQPNNTGALSALAGVRFQQRDFIGAAELYNRVLTINPQDTTAQTSLIALNAAQGLPLAALQQLQQLQRQQIATTGVINPALLLQQQQIQEGLLLQRGIQPPWERF